jgi:catabolite regulation protein CreA
MCCYFTVLPSNVSFENVAPQNRLLGTEGQDLPVSCKAVGGIPAPNVVLKIDGEYVTNQTQSVQHTLNTINRSYDRKTVTCQAGNPAYLQDPISNTAVIYLNCK